MSQEFEVGECTGFNLTRRGFIGGVVGGVITACSKGEKGVSMNAEQTETNGGEYPSHEVIATVYWVGEGATADNDYISNVPTAWDEHAVERFGGVDDPAGRNFEPKHNTFYVALPASEFDESGLIKGAHEASPWADEELVEGESLFKGRWLELRSGGETTYAQWHDVGPNVEDDYGYVFGEGEPTNTFGEHAGIDLSPDVAKFLGLQGSGVVSWCFIDTEKVPDGPWKTYPALDNKTYWG